MPTNELLAEVQALRQLVANGKEIILQKTIAEETLRMALDIRKKRAERATHMAALWKRLAKVYKYAIENVYEPQADAQLERICKEQAELAALKKDARICADYVEHDYYFEETREAARRIIEATKEGE